MVTMEKKIKRFGEIVFYIALSLEMLYVILDKSDYILPYETWLFRLTFVFFCIKILCSNYTVKQWCVIFAMGALGILSFLATDREEIIRVVAFLAAFKGMDLKRVLKVTFYENLLGCLAIVLLSVTGIYGEVSVTGMFRGGGVEETRFCLGMGHPNALHCMVFVLLVLAMAIYYEKMKWHSFVLLQAVNVGFYLLTDSRTGMLVATIAVLFGAFLRYAKRLREKKVLYILAICLFVALVLFTVFISMYGVSIPILRQIDIRINGRFQYGKSDGGMQFWSLFSNAANQAYFDMGFMRVFYWYGIVPGIVYVLAHCALIWRCYKEKAYGAFLTVMMFAVYTFIEAHAVSVFIGRNFVLLFMGAMWYTVLGQKEEKEIGLCTILNAKTR